MQTEIEVKFLSIDHEDMRTKLEKLGGSCAQAMRVMRREIMDFPSDNMQLPKGTWLRIRDEGDKITLTLKKVEENRVDGAQEIEVNVTDYNKTVQIFETIGMQSLSYQESKRETWHLDSVEVVLDEWPWLDPFIEIEGPSEAEVRAAAQKLGLDWQDGVFGTVNTIYRTQYPGIATDKDISDIKKVIFNSPKPEWFGDKS